MGKEFCYCDAIKWCIRANKIYHAKKKHALFLPIAVSMLFPTIYHFAGYGDAVLAKKPEPSLLRTSAIALDAKLRDCEFLDWHFKFLLSMHEVLQQTTSGSESTAAAIIKIWPKQQQQMENDNLLRNDFVVITQSEYRLYFEALLSEGHIDKFFVECTRLFHRHKGYEVAVIAADLMDNEGYKQLTQYLEQQSNDRFDDLSNPKHKNLNLDEVRLKKCCDAVVCIVNICENCPELPKCLKLNLPKYLKKFQNNLANSFKMMDAKYKKNEKVKANMNRLGKDLNRRIKHIQESKINTEYFFRNEIHSLTSMVDTFCL